MVILASGWVAFFFSENTTRSSKTAYYCTCRTHTPIGTEVLKYRVKYMITAIVREVCTINIHFIDC